jgi:hypothetical protein
LAAEKARMTPHVQRTILRSKMCVAAFSGVSPCVQRQCAAQHRQAITKQRSVSGAHQIHREVASILFRLMR